jgi:putative addiction module component (TIGR02574 family)
MMNPLSSDDVKRLSPQDRLALIEQLWDSLDDADVPVTEAQIAEVERRLADPGDQAGGVTWDRLKAEIKQRRS